MNPTQPPAEQERSADDAAHSAADKPVPEAMSSPSSPPSPPPPSPPPSSSPPPSPPQDDTPASAKQEDAPADEAPRQSAPEYEEFTVPLDAATKQQREDDADNASTEPPAQPPYGVELKEARERIGVAPADVAASLHLEEAVIRAVEAGREDDLPARVYVRGYIRAYANLLGLDPDRLIANFDEAHEPPEAVPAPVIGGATKVEWSGNLPQRRAGLFLGVIVVVIVVALVFALWGVWRTFDWSFVTDAGDKEPSAAWRSEATVAEETPPAADAASPVATDVQPAENGRDEPASAAPVSASVSELLFTFKEDSWVEVKDRAGSVYANEGKAEESVTVSGHPPFTIVIGYAAGVELRYQGEVISLVPHTQNGIANLVVH